MPFFINSDPAPAKQMMHYSTSYSVLISNSELFACRRHLEVVYKCKPASFRSRVVCGGESLELTCPDGGQRLAILSAGFLSAAAGGV
jgi:hypothetical protein